MYPVLPLKRDGIAGRAMERSPGRNPVVVGTTDVRIVLDLVS